MQERAIKERRELIAAQQRQADIESLNHSLERMNNTIQQINQSNANMYNQMNQYNQMQQINRSLNGINNSLQNMSNGSSIRWNNVY